MTFCWCRASVSSVVANSRPHSSLCQVFINSLSVTAEDELMQEANGGTETLPPELRGSGKFACKNAIMSLLSDQDKARPVYLQIVS